MDSRSTHKRKIGNDEVYISRKHVEPLGKKSKQISEEEQNPVEEGEIVNISDLLFTKKRDYLIKYKDNQLVKDMQLAGKVIILHFVSLVNGQHNFWKQNTAHLLDIYDKLEPKGGFEVVFVAIRDDIPSCDTAYSTPHERFEQRFSTMPWTAIPFSDLKSRKRLERIFGIFKYTLVDEEPASIVIDPRGVVVQDNAMYYFKTYGAAGFPFTNQRFECIDSEDSECIESEDNVAGMKICMETLLASPERDYVITNKGERVPVHKLQDKVVGLFFFTDTFGKRITRKLKMAYEELSKNMENFEVVLINLLPLSSNRLAIPFEEMPWLAIPFEDTDCSKKLLRMFEAAILKPGPTPVSTLVIIGPHGEILEPFGAHILMREGIPAYPFTRWSAVKSRIENVKDVKPEMLWNLNAVFRQRDGSEVRFSQIVGKRIIVLFLENCRGISGHALNKLKALYIQMTGTHDEFEVIHIHKGREFVSPMPWLMHLPFDLDSDACHVMNRLIGYCSCGLVAFDRDGTIVRMTQYPGVGKMVFPFYSGDGMEDEVLETVENYIDDRLPYW